MVDKASYTGGCLCGVVRFRVLAEPGPIDICHCSQCRNSSWWEITDTLEQREAE